MLLTVGSPDIRNPEPDGWPDGLRNGYLNVDSQFRSFEVIMESCGGTSAHPLYP
jgi:hypothetical protein